MSGKSMVATAFTFALLTFNSLHAFGLNLFEGYEALKSPERKIVTEALHSAVRSTHFVDCDVKLGRVYSKGKDSQFKVGLGESYTPGGLYRSISGRQPILRDVFNYPIQEEGSTADVRYFLDETGTRIVKIEAIIGKVGQVLLGTIPHPSKTLAVVEDYSFTCTAID